MRCAAAGPPAQEPVVERFEVDPAPGQLTVQILVPVKAELGCVGKIGAELDEERLRSPRPRSKNNSG